MPTTNAPTKAAIDAQMAVIAYKHLGFTIPTDAPKSVGSDSVVGATFAGDPHYLRLALSDIVRTRR